MYRAVLSGALLGVEAGQVWVEVDVSNGLPTVNMVGSLGQEVRDVTMVRLIQSIIKKGA